MNQDVFIWGNEERGGEVIKELEKRGGTNRSNCSGKQSEIIYFIYKGKINLTYGKSTLGDIIQRHFIEIKLPEPKEKVHFEPFDKVLACQGENSCWVAAHFTSYIKETNAKHRYNVSFIRFKYCIPYEGNEHLNNEKFKLEHIEKYDFE